MSKHLIDRANQDIFRAHGTRLSSATIYRCTVCERGVSIEDSYSSQGRNLICCNCADNMFGRCCSEAVLEWIGTNVWTD